MKPKKKEEIWAASERRNFQRNQTIRGLIGCDDKDIIMISDLDEILA